MRRIALENHEFVAGRLAVRFLDLDGDQKEAFQKTVKTWSSRVATTDVDRIAAKIEAFGSTADPGGVAIEIQLAVRDLLVESCTDFAPVLASLNPAQIDHLKEKIAERNEKYDPEQHGGLEKFRKLKLDEQIESTEQWLGTVSAAQRVFMRDLALQKNDAGGKWEADYLTYSREAQDGFLAILVKHRGDADGLGRKCAEYARDPDASLTAASRSTKAAVSDFRKKSLAGIFATMDEAQRTHLQREAAKLAADLKAWAQRVRDESGKKSPAP